MFQVQSREPGDDTNNINSTIRQNRIFDQASLEIEKTTHIYWRPVFLLICFFAETFQAQMPITTVVPSRMVARRLALRDRASNRILLVWASCGRHSRVNGLVCCGEEEDLQQPRND